MVGVSGFDLERVLELSSPEETSALGERLGQVLAPGDFVGLVGELGAGKTHFSRAVAKGAGVDPKEVTSPTFAIVYPYRGRLPLYHADLYRLADADELYATGYFDLLQGDGALLVEWLDKVPEAAPEQLLRVELEVTGDQTRRARVGARGERAVALARRWLGAG